MAEQQDPARQFALKVQRQVDYEWSEKHRGYMLRKTAGTRFGFVRLNIAGANKGRFAVYVYAPFEDHRGLFLNCQRGQPYHGWHTFIDPADLTTIEYAVKVLESAWDAR